MSSIEIKIIVDGIEYEFVPKEIAARTQESADSGAQTGTPESTDSQSTQTTPEVAS